MIARMHRKQKLLVDKARACLVAQDTPRTSPWVMLGVAFVMMLTAFVLLGVVIFGPGFEYFSPRTAGPEILMSLMRRLP